MTRPADDKTLKRILDYCAKAERCSHDVRRKLSAWQVEEEESESILHKLRSDKFLDDDRFIKSYVAEKWNLDQFGKEKIKNNLLQKGFSEASIHQALENIDDKQYREALEKILRQKENSLQEGDPATLARKLYAFGLAKGFEEELVLEWIEKQGFSFEQFDP